MVEHWVVDCSAVAALLLNEDDAPATERLVIAAAAGNDELTVTVPALFWFEIVNVLLMAERRGRIDSVQAISLRRELDGLPIRTDPPPGLPERRRLHELAAAHRLTAYDAAYLELAEREAARLKTLDPDLLRLRRRFPWIE